MSIDESGPEFKPYPDDVAQGYLSITLVHAIIFEKYDRINDVGNKDWVFQVCS